MFNYACPAPLRAQHEANLSRIARARAHHGDRGARGFELATVPTDSFTFRPVRHVRRLSHATTVYGNALDGWVDSSAARQIFLRFDVTGIGDRAVRNVRLRLYQHGRVRERRA